MSRKPKDLVELYSLIDSQYSSRRTIPLHIFVVLTKASAAEIQRLAEAHRLRITMRPTESKRLFEITLGLRKRTVRGWLVLADSHWLFLIQPSESSTIAGDIAERWLAEMFPELAPARIDSNHLLDLLEELAGLEETSLQVNSYVLRREGETDYPTAKSWEGKRGFDRSKIADYAISMNRLVDAAHLTLGSKQNTMFEARVSRSGHLTYYRGSESGFSDFLRLVSSRIVKIAREEVGRLEGLEARFVEDDFAVRPLAYSITSEGETFEDGIENLERALTQKSWFNYSVEHSGNPWYSVHLIDRGDGSIYDVNIFSHLFNIVPLTRATSVSLSRLKNIVEGVFPSARLVKEEAR